MGNSESAVEDHVEQARKTGVCSLKDRKLSQVSYTPARVSCTIVFTVE